MGRRRGVMSEEFKFELAKDLGFYETVVREGWEGIRTKDAGNMVKRAIQIAEEKLAQDYRRNQQTGTAVQMTYRPQPAASRPQSYGAGMPQTPAGSFAAGPEASVQPRQFYQQPQPPAFAYSRQTGSVPVTPSIPAYIPVQQTNATPSYLN